MYKKHIMIDVNFQEKYCQQQKKAAIAQKAYANVSSILYHLSGVNNGIQRNISGYYTPSQLTKIT